jgi:hypothetical protein
MINQNYNDLLLEKLEHEIWKNWIGLGFGLILLFFSL